MRGVSLAVAVLAMLLSSRVSAHEAFEVTTDARVHPDRLELRITMASRAASAFCKGLGKRPGDFELSDLEEFPRFFENCAVGLFSIVSGGALLAPVGARVELTVEHEFNAVVTYPSPKPGLLRFHAAHLERVRDAGLGTTVTVVGEGVFLGQALLRPEEPAFEVLLEDPADPSRVLDRTAPSSSFRDFLRLGIEHILTGYDHLLFLLGVLLGCRGLRSALLLVTSFTLAHSLTLALSVLDLLTLPSRWVEPAIALSLIFVGIENLWRGERIRARLLLTFLFGLIHGLGFAGVLRDLGLGANGAPIVLPLFAFNLGVELGQAAVAGIALPLLFRLNEMARFARHGRTVLSLLVSAAGLYWLLVRLIASA